MPFGVDDAIAVAGVVKGIAQGNGSARRRRAISELRAARPSGYLNPDDYLYGERTTGRLLEGVHARAGEERVGVQRRSRARGLAGSPSEERSLARVADSEALGAEHANEAGQEQLYNMRTGRESFEQRKALAIFGANMDDAGRADAQHGAFWNSLLEYMPTILGGIGSKTSYEGSANPADSTFIGPPGFDPESAVPYIPRGV